MLNAGSFTTLLITIEVCHKKVLQTHHHALIIANTKLEAKT